jgi:hypothetical protein
MVRNRLEKVLSYRDLSGHTLETHTDHWRGFSWEAGPIVVSHEGAAWGTVKVWAVSAAEGKRVIRHAAEIAGLNPDAVGKWYTHSARNPRYGRTGTMVPKPLRNGAISVTMRPGPSGLPEVAVPAPGL